MKTICPQNACRTSMRPAAARRPMTGVTHAGGGSNMQLSGNCEPARPAHLDRKQLLVDRLLAAKEATKKTFSQIGAEIGCSNLYTASLFYNQQQLKAGTVECLQKAVPGLDQHLVDEMLKAPSRRFDPQLIQDPTVYRLYEAIMHNGEALKAIVNEEGGDGIMSAIDMYADVGSIIGKHGEKRIVVTLNGKYLPFVEGLNEDNVAL